MTRKQALMRVCEILKKHDQTEEITEIQYKLQEIIQEIPFTSWSEATIFDTIDQWIIENGKVPSTKDLTRKGLPPVPVIRNRFKMQASEFLDIHYPNRKLLCKPKKYGNKSREEWIAYFKENYDSIEPQTSHEYNKNRGAATPTWQTIAQMCGLSGWHELLYYCGLEKSPQKAQAGKKKTGTIFTVHRESDLEKALKKLESE